ncbi:MAG: N-acetylmuramoyl-L-alanine amidase, partial [Lachnospiraceae bacterium]|nr:N-acetylmuramoyl-L-alanine amidase [Lachnospiraceae bacterium]
NQMGTIDRGIIFRDNLGVIKRTYMPSVLLELGFIDSPVDADMLQNRQEDMAWAIANGFFELLGMSPMSRAKNSRRPRETSRDRVHKEGPPSKASSKNSVLPFLLFMTICGKK